MEAGSARRASRFGWTVSSAHINGFDIDKHATSKRSVNCGAGAGALPRALGAPTVAIVDRYGKLEVATSKQQVNRGIGAGRPPRAFDAPIDAFVLRYGDLKCTTSKSRWSRANLPSLVRQRSEAADARAIV
ncbi:hypothetical protein DWV00_19130 [Trinickia dinghuensis]|uniref:Uncharacterized protein n=1 Tax=Trinickia dinghuensis TaxID=2291023 RepID=A0A3D8JXH4_9BURK|nr:hypothetical protein DWV00_19130 [Trinickia dinghuensis]